MTNLERRHLNQGQKAMLALEYEKAYADATRKDRILSNGGHAEQTKVPDLVPASAERKSAAKAARVVGASKSAVIQAKAVQRDAPDLADKVRSGQMALEARTELAEVLAAFERERAVATAALVRIQSYDKAAQRRMTALTIRCRGPKAHRLGVVYGTGPVSDRRYLLALSGVRAQFLDANPVDIEYAWAFGHGCKCASRGRLTVGLSEIVDALEGGTPVLFASDIVVDVIPAQEERDRAKREWIEREVGRPVRANPDYEAWVASLHPRLRDALTRGRAGESA